MGQVPNMDQEYQVWTKYGPITKNTKYGPRRMDQVKFLKASLEKIWSDMLFWMDQVKFFGSQSL